MQPDDDLLGDRTDHQARDLGNDARLAWLEVADDPEAWAAAGFAVDGAETVLGETRVRLCGVTEGERRGIRRWGLAGLDLAGLDGTLDGLHLDGLHLDGLATEPVDLADIGPEVPGELAGPAAARHPNGCTGIDHVVVATPDLDRTIAALGAVGLGCRRIRETESYGAPMRQAFFRLGPVVLEVVSTKGANDTGSGEGADEAPATWFGLAVDVDDLDVTATVLGEGLGSIKGAVQAGRRIATLRHKGYGMSVAVAAMDSHGDR